MLYTVIFCFVVFAIIYWFYYNTNDVFDFVNTQYIVKRDITPSTTTTNTESTTTNTESTTTNTGTSTTTNTGTSTTNNTESTIFEQPKLKLSDLLADVEN
jgi:hypothetical protein